MSFRVSTMVYNQMMTLLWVSAPSNVTTKKISVSPTAGITAGPYISRSRTELSAILSDFPVTGMLFGLWVVTEDSGFISCYGPREEFICDRNTSLSVLLGKHPVHTIRLLPNPRLEFTSIFHTRGLIMPAIFEVVRHRPSLVILLSFSTFSSVRRVEGRRLERSQYSTEVSQRLNQ